MQQVRDDLLALWFGEDPDDSAVAAEKKNLWWGHSPETDEMLRERFGTASTSGAVGILDHWTGSPRGRLALILLLDQIPRAINRGRHEAFAYDADALQVAAQGLASGAIACCGRSNGSFSICRSNTPKSWPTRNAASPFSASLPNRFPMAIARPSTFFSTLRSATTPLSRASAGSRTATPFSDVSRHLKRSSF